LKCESDKIISGAIERSNKSVVKYHLKLKRVYEKAEKNDGFRVLVDRLWPRGVSKKKAKIDFWLKDVAPSNELRRWFGHDPAKWNEFQKRYKKELKAKKDAVRALKNIIKKEKAVTLLFSASDERRNNAAALAKILKLRLSSK
jgi:uncharacterized protein YeaO (DUF488 family)